MMLIYLHKCWFRLTIDLSHKTRDVQDQLVKIAPNYKYIVT